MENPQPLLRRSVWRHMATLLQKHSLGGELVLGLTQNVFKEVQMHVFLKPLIGISRRVSRRSSVSPMPLAFLALAVAMAAPVVFGALAFALLAMWRRRAS